MPRTRNSSHTNRTLPTDTEEHNPIPRPRRRARAPGGELGRKLKEKVAPSPLPPSSPVLASPSSQPDSLPVASSEAAESLAAKWWREKDDDAEGDPDLEYHEMEEEEDEDESQLPPPPQYIHPSQASDPFGFFAVEKKLKEERLKHPGPPAKPNRIARIQPPPPINTEPLKPPRTPHKQRIGKRPSASYSDISSANILDDASLPSSPSPTKRPMKRRPLVDEPSAENITVEEQQPLPNKGSQKKKARTGGTSVNPDRLDKDLRALLPRRPGVSTRRRRKPTEDSDDEIEEDTRKKTTRRKGKGKAVRKQGVDDEEELEDERKARLEYFKKLDGYQIHKENVYVV